MKAPTFEPWVARIRIVRAWLAVLGFVATAAISYTNGIAVDDAALRGLAVAVVCYFVGWASALWMFSELHAAQIARLRRRLEEHEQERHAQLQDLYNQRVEAMNASMGVSAQQPPPSAASPGAQGGRRAA